MTIQLLVSAVTLLASLCAGGPLAAQQMTYGPQASSLFGSPHPADPRLQISPAETHDDGPNSVSSARKRPRWRYPAAGALAGGLAGAVWGTVLMWGVGDWVAPPAHVLTVPVGVLAGALVGVIVEVATPQ